MASEAKKLALLRILEILQRNTDEAHPLTHNEIADMLLKNYGIEIERKAVGRNISLLLEADYDIVTTKRGVYLNERKFEPSEVRMLIDGVLSSQHIGVKHSRDLIEKLASEENKYFRQRNATDFRAEKSRSLLVGSSKPISNHYSCRQNENYAGQL